jgi:hypothetical protein
VGALSKATTTATDKGLVAEVLRESVTWTVKLYNPPTLGVPDMTPVDVLSVKPVGNAPGPIDHA